MEAAAASLDQKLSKPNTKAGRLQRACLALLKEHEEDGALPTSNRFLFYELVSRDIIPKSYPGKRQPAQYISEALTHLREIGEVSWSWIVDETRSLYNWRYAHSVYQYVEDGLSSARLDPWEGNAPPLILCESRSLSGVLRDTAGRYLAPITSTNGQVGGFLHTDVGPLLKSGHSKDGVPVRVLYLGDLDLSGGHIEENTRKVLEGYADLEWRRIAITEEQAHERDLPEVEKKDNRFKPARTFPAIETEALKQTEIQRILEAELSKMLPEPLEGVRQREEDQRVLVREALAPLEADSGEANGHKKSLIPEFFVDAVVGEVENVVWTRSQLENANWSGRGAVRRELRRQIARRLLREE